MNLSVAKRTASMYLLITLLPFIIVSFHDNAANPSALSAAPKKAAAKAKRPTGPKMFALNFKDVEITEFINVMGQVIQKNIIIDDRVKGKISISSSKKVPLSEAYNVMKAILEVKGLAVVETPNLIKILPIEDAVKKNSSVIVDGKVLLDERSITYILELKNADANEVANALRSLKPKTADIIIYQSLNMLIITGITSDVNSLVHIARALDSKVAPLGQEKYGGNIHVYHLENANAEDLANVLSRIPFSDTAKISTSPISTPQPSPQPTPQKVEPSDKTRRVTMQHGSAAASKEKLSIIANKDTNSLIITAKPDEYAEIVSIIKQLDIVRDQVLIEAMIVEVNVENGWGFGIDWMLGYQTGKHIFGGSSIQSSKIPSYTLPDGVTDKKLAVPLNTGFQLGYVPDIGVLAFALLNASATDNNFNILSTPQVLTVDNNEAELNVGEEIGVPTNNRITDQNTTFQTYEYKTVGIKLKITPHITQKKRITLDLYQEVNSIIGETQQLSGGSLVPPKLGKRDIKTKVTVYDGKTIVVGGLIQNKKDVTESKLPILGDIPLLGWFFKHKTVNYKKSNLLVFITPHILTKKDRLESITKQKIETMRRLKTK
ncbi:MAG TPA: secretin N-terminal domain-containing protein [Spirochaetota bacterium]|nr:secretin N-terminal domain-containing protein [Spirochaetota bacterium]